MRRRGVTLVELLVALVLLALLLAIVPLTAPRGASSSGDWRARLDHDRSRAIANGVAITSFSDSTGRYTARADGFIVADSMPRFRLSGARDAN